MQELDEKEFLSVSSEKLQIIEQEKQPDADDNFHLRSSSRICPKTN